LDLRRLSLRLSGLSRHHLAEACNTKNGAGHEREMARARLDAGTHVTSPRKNFAENVRCPGACQPEKSPDAPDRRAPGKRRQKPATKATLLEVKHPEFISILGRYAADWAAPKSSLNPKPRYL
jgi:hypothetical protein